LKALVTGGAGFIGSHLVDALTARGDEVVVLDDLSSGRAANIASAIDAGARLIPADVTDAGAVERICQSPAPDRVFHLAAQIDVRVSTADPAHDARVNVEGTVNVLESARRAGTRRLVLASSCAVYGEPSEDRLPLAEDAPLRPGNPYGQSKLAAEGYLALYRSLYGMETAALRFGNVFGPRQGAAGEGGVVSIFAEVLRAGGVPSIFGDGGQTRDFVYVGDIVAALIAASDRGATGEMNVATGSETSVSGLFELMTSIAGADDARPRMQPPRLGEVRRMSLDAARLHAACGWTPEVALRDGLERTWRSLDGEAAAVGEGGR
jgi:UDP-glucose 4-epimerase